MSNKCPFHLASFCTTNIQLFLNSRLRRLQRENAEFSQQQAQAAQDAISLMVDHAQKKVDKERACQGLVIISALYGSRDAFSEDGDSFDYSEKITEVTVPVQALVQESHLFVPGDRSKSNLLGFYVSYLALMVPLLSPVPDEFVCFPLLTGPMHRRAKSFEDRIPFQEQDARSRIRRPRGRASAASGARRRRSD